MIEFIIGFYIGMFITCCMNITRVDRLFKLESNWDKLKKFISVALEIYNNVDVKTLNMIKDKMEELEKGDDKK